ncbi:16S rRNA (uracil(1498)-N(3))-methyltransferase [Agreia sp.]|uniref:16S rRNA (uracil(1498)-N(3))-methyltransferase n=1 Tax=Agreia sp. TaxID=1872416 RepID=UPI0035BBC785
MSSLFLRSDLARAPHAVGDAVALAGPEARHAVTVNRLRVGEVISIGDGSGLSVRGPIVTVEAAALEIRVESTSFDEAPAPEVWLAQALAKGDRDELAVQAATELGASGVIPWAAERSVSKWTGAKVAKGTERWGAIVREAAKQSIRSWVPAVEQHMNTKQLARLAAEATVLVLDPTAEARLSHVDLPPDARILILVVGPEGGIAPHELDLFEREGAIRVRLGDEILRTSTAGPSALSVLNVRLDRW